jgi:GNAT superfamily N-acetyltransferase
MGRGRQQEAGIAAERQTTPAEAIAVALGGEISGRERGFSATDSTLISVPDGEIRINARIEPWWASDHETGEQTIVINDLEARPRGAGLGTKAVEALKGFADDNGLHIAFWHPTAQALAFYRRFDWLAEHPSSFDYRHR